MASTQEAASLPCTLVIGASGAIGRRLVRALLQTERHRVVVCLHRSPLPPETTEGLLESSSRLLTCTFGVDVRSQEKLNEVMQKYIPACVWNLAAPLSVDTAKDPCAARGITVSGMERILYAMEIAGCGKKICFTDSIGSFGAEAPREPEAKEEPCPSPSERPQRSGPQ